MASNFWIKLYHEILHDPKMGRLPDNVWRRAIELFLLAGELDEEGKLPNTEDTAWLLHRPNIEELEAELAHLEKVGILTRTADGWLVTKFAERQKAITDADRAKAYRERKRKQQFESPVTQENNEPVTPESQKRHEPITKRDADIDIESDIDKESKDSLEALPDSKKWNNANKKTVGDKFLELTHLKPPPPKSKTAGAWWGWLYEIFEMAGKDSAEACRIMEVVINHSISEHLTITSPKSLLGMANTVASGQPLNTKNGALKNGRTKTPQSINRAGPAHPPAAATGLGEWTEDEKRQLGFS